MMYKKVYKKTIICIFFILFLTEFLFSQKTNSDSSIYIDNMDRSRISVLTGSPTSKPVLTNYGFLIIQENRFLASYSKNGQCLWQRNLGAKILGYTIGENEFIYVITSRNELALLNPSGLILWKKSINFTAKPTPLEGYDSRIFVQGNNNLCCYGIGGSKKWSISTEKQSSLPMKKIDDGSIIVFLEKMIKGKSCAIRVSPFGEIIEEIVFQGKVINSFETENGLMVVFSNGDIGTISIKTDESKNNSSSNNSTREKKGYAYSKWLNKEIACTINSSCIKINKSNFAIITPGKNITIINSENGKSQNSFSISEINNTILTINYLDNKFILSDSEKTIAYYSNGKKYKTFIHPSKTGKYKWNFMTFSDAGFLLYFSDDWSINSFKIFSTSREKINYNFSNYKKNLRNYNSFYELNEFIPEGSYFSKEIISILKSENYGNKEIKISNNVYNAINSYLMDKNSIELNSDTSNLLRIEYSPMDMENIINTLPYFETAQISEKIAQMLSVETDKTLIIKLLQAVNKCAYDPSGDIMLQIEHLIKNSNPNDKLVLEYAINSVYEICKFMGRPAFISKGKVILANLFYPQYDEQTKKSVRLVMQKLADLNM